MSLVSSQQKSDRQSELKQEQLRDKGAEQPEIDLQATLPPLPAEQETKEPASTLVAYQPPQETGPGDREPSPDRSTTLDKHVEVFASTKQHEIAKIHVIDEGKPTERYISRYTEKLCELIASGKASSIEAAHDQLARIAAADPKTYPFTPVRTHRAGDPEWTRTSEKQPERGTLILRGGTLKQMDYAAFTADVKLVQKTAVDQLGVDINKAYVLYGADPDRIEKTFDRLAKAGVKQLLVYYSGHGMIDKKGVSLKTADGSVTRDQWNKDLADTLPNDPKTLRIRGTKSEKQGSDPGAIFIHDLRMTVLHEERLYAMLNRRAKEHGMTIRLVLDTDHGGAFIPQDKK